MTFFIFILEIFVLKLNELIDVSHLKINKDISYYRRDGKLFVTFSILCTSEGKFSYLFINLYYVNIFEVKLTLFKLMCV